jgi:hypothetical protein
VSVQFDTSELRALAADLGGLAPKVTKDVHGVLRRGAMNIKKGWRDNAKESAGAHGKRYPYSIEFEQTRSADGVAFEIGPNADKPQGAMSFEFGSSRQPPHMDGQRALDAEAPNLEVWVGKALDGLL